MLCGWERVHLNGIPDARPPAPRHVEVWLSVRDGGDTKTRKSRRTLALPARCVEAFRKQWVQQAADSLLARDEWQESGLVFTTAVGSELEAANVRRDLRRALALVPPRRGRHASCGTRSYRPCPTRVYRVEQISQLMGHPGEQR